MTEVNLLTCPWGPRNPARKEKGTRVSKQADLENTKHPRKGISQGTSHLLGVDGQLVPPTTIFCAALPAGRQSSFGKTHSFRYKFMEVQLKEMFQLTAGTLYFRCLLFSSHHKKWYNGNCTDIITEDAFHLKQNSEWKSTSVFNCASLYVRAQLRAMDVFWFSSLPGVSLLFPSSHAHTEHVCLNKISGIYICNSPNIHNYFRTTWIDQV